MKVFDKITATFTPISTDDLQNDGEKWVGESGIFQAMWEIEDGKYKGEMAMMPPTDWPFAWCPERDLQA